MELFGIEKAARITGVGATRIRYWLDTSAIDKDSESRDQHFSEETVVWIWLLSQLRDRGCHYKKAATIARSIHHSPQLSTANFIVAHADGDEYAAYESAEMALIHACESALPVVMIDLSEIRNSVRAAIGPSQIDIPIGAAETDPDWVEI